MGNLTCLTKSEEHTVHRWERSALRGPDGLQHVLQSPKWTVWSMCNNWNRSLSGRVHNGLRSYISRYEARTDLVVFDRGSVTAQRYVEEVLQDHGIPFSPFIGENFRLMHDNARCYTGRFVVQYFVKDRSEQKNRAHSGQPAKTCPSKNTSPYDFRRA